MNVLTFTISGPFAHFRKIYGTNTAMSYGIPPRTTLTGMLAAIMGWPKDHYYEAMQPAHIRVGVSLLAPIRKSFHRVNHLAIKSTGDFRGRQGHTQTPMEMISGLDLRQDMVRYRVFLAPGETGEDLFIELADMFEVGQPHYALSLGAAFCPAFIEEVENYTLGKEELIPALDRAVSLQSAVNRNWVDRFELRSDTRLRVDEDVFPHFFASNQSRRLGGSIQLIHGSQLYPLPVWLKRPAYRLPHEDQAFVFLEE